MPTFKKGNAIIGQSGGPTAAINATLAGVIRACLETNDIGTLYGMRNGIEGLLNRDIFPLDGYFRQNKEERLSLLASTPAAALGSCRKKLTDEADIRAILDILEENEVRYFFYIGGNDSMDAVAMLSAYAASHPDAYRVNFVGIPKTIDNDLVLTDHTPGYGSAAKYIAVSMQEILRDIAVYTTKAVTIVEIMGRDSGWLTAASALTKPLCGIGPDLVYLPERPFDEEAFLAALTEKLREKNAVAVAVSEGIRDKNGKYAAEAAMSGVTDSFGHKYLSGTGKYLETLVRNRIGCKVRSVELNILQRCASHIASRTDIEESMRIGEAAVRHALFGVTGSMIALRRLTQSDSYDCEISVEDVERIANQIKRVPDDFITADSTGVTPKAIDYMLPLIRGEYPSTYKDGLPLHFVFDERKTQE